jgi:hypothetical protein
MSGPILSLRRDKSDRTEGFFARLDLLWARLAVHIRAEHLCVFSSILGASFSNIGTGPTYEEAQGVIDQLHLDHESFMCELGERVNVLLKRPNGWY